MVVLQKDSWNGQYAQEAVKKTLLDLMTYIIFLIVVSISEPIIQIITLLTYIYN